MSNDSGLEAFGEEEEKEEEVEPRIRKIDVFMSPQDVIIECKDEKIRSHCVVLRQCKYFATLLDNTDLGSYGPDKIKIITLPAAFHHRPSEVREFLMMLYNALDKASGALTIFKENVIALAELAHYFDAPEILHLCDKNLARKYSDWFPDKVLWLTQLAIKNHLPKLRAVCMAKLDTSVDGTELLAHLNNGRGDLSKDSVFMTEIVTTLHQKFTTLQQKFTALEQAFSRVTKNSRILQSGAAKAIHNDLRQGGHLLKMKGANACERTIDATLKKYIIISDSDAALAVRPLEHRAFAVRPVHRRGLPVYGDDSSSSESEQ